MATDDAAVEGMGAAREFLAGVQARIREEERQLDKLRAARAELALLVHGEPWCNHDGPTQRVCECGEVIG